MVNFIGPAGAAYVDVCHQTMLMNKVSSFSRPSPTIWPTTRAERTGLRML